MNSWSLLVGGLVGMGLAAFGVRVLVTGRGPAPILRAFPAARDAGLYHLLFGVALLLVVGGTRMPGRYTDSVAVLIGIVLVGVAVVRFRPRKAASKETAEKGPSRHTG